MTEHTSNETMQSDPARKARLEELRKDLDDRLDELVSAGSDRVAKVKERFDRSWKELNDLLDPGATRH